MDDYDEDLHQNPFFKALTTKGKQIYQQAIENRRTVCQIFINFLKIVYFNNLFFKLLQISYISYNFLRED